MSSQLEVSVAELGRVVTGKTPSTKNHAFFGGQFQFVTPSDLNFNHYYCHSTGTTVTEEAKSAQANQFIPAGAVMFTCIGNTIGKCAISSEECLTNQQINSVIPHRSDEAKFIYYLLINNVEVFRNVGFSGGVATPIINKTTFSGIKLRVPPQESWVKIGDILSGYDDLIENNTRQIELLEEYARHLYREWFVYLRFPGHEHASKIDKVPEGWTKEPLENLLVLQRGFDLPLDQRKAGDIPIIASTGVNGFHSEAKVSAPGVVTGRSGSLGTVMYISKDFWPLNTSLWVKEFKKVSPVFATFLLRSMALQNYNGGAAVPTLNRNDVHKVEVICPDSKVIELFDSYVQPVFNQIEHLNEYNKKLSKARDTLLPRLMNGEITV